LNPNWSCGYCHDPEDVSFDRKVAVASQPVERRILYYRNPMGLPDISPTPKKDSMGMDYVPVYEGEDDDGFSVKISPGRRQRIGMKSEAAQKRKAATLLTLVALSAAGSGGFWIGRHGLAPAAMIAPDPAMSSSLRAASGPVIYYQDPDGKPFYSLEPKQTSDGRPSVARRARERASLPSRCARPAPFSSMNAGLR
jgi:hypothetical protein